MPLTVYLCRLQDTTAGMTRKSRGADIENAGVYMVCTKICVACVVRNSLMAIDAAGALCML